MQQRMGRRDAFPASSFLDLVSHQRLSKKAYSGPSPGAWRGDPKAGPRWGLWLPDVPCDCLFGLHVTALCRGPWDPGHEGKAGLQGEEERRRRQRLVFQLSRGIAAERQENKGVKPLVLVSRPQSEPGPAAGVLRGAMGPAAPTPLPPLQPLSWALYSNPHSRLSQFWVSRISLLRFLKIF